MYFTTLDYYFSLMIYYIRRGLKLKIIDQKVPEDNPSYSNAAYMNTRSLEVLEPAGIRARLEKQVLYTL